MISMFVFSTICSQGLWFLCSGTWHTFTPTSWTLKIY